MSFSQLDSSKVLELSEVAFGTSGARGLVSDFTPEVCAAFVHAFLKVVEESFSFETVALAIDNRPSSYGMAKACAKAIEQAGYNVTYYGVIPTPALALSSMMQQIPCIMITGSHIPFDRNGLKFYRPDGEITKQDEESIVRVHAKFEPLSDLSELEVDSLATENYIQRYTSLFSKPVLAGLRIGIYEHSSAGRDLYYRLFKELGAEVICLDRTDTFVPIDTEAVSEEDCQKARDWSKEYNLDAIFSTDGDGDRPLLADESGEWLRGDILGLICARALDVEALAVPVSCNTAIELSGNFNCVTRTRIGSPYVIAEFSKLAQSYKSVAGFEANGGFLLATDALINGVQLSALPTRDAVLPAVMALAASVNSSISELVNALPSRFTASDRLKNFATERSNVLLSKANESPEDFLNGLGFMETTIAEINTIDGLRVTLDNLDVVHLRPSGNAPELRCYAEASTSEQAFKLVDQALKAIA